VRTTKVRGTSRAAARWPAGGKNENSSHLLSRCYFPPQSDRQSPAFNRLPPGTLLPLNTQGRGGDGGPMPFEVGSRLIERASRCETGVFCVASNGAKRRELGKERTKVAEEVPKRTRSEDDGPFASLPWRVEVFFTRLTPTPDSIPRSGRRGVGGSKPNQVLTYSMVMPCQRRLDVDVRSPDGRTGMGRGLWIVEVGRNERRMKRKGEDRV
jgi:hypothetical protein